MASTLLGRVLRALPVYLLGVLMVLGISHALGNTTVVAATIQPPRAASPSPPLRLAVPFGPFIIPVLLPNPVD